MMSEDAESTGRGVVAVVVRHGRILVIRRARFVVAPGAVCLVREIREELGVTIRPERRLWETMTAWHVYLSWWLSHWDPVAPLVPNPAEVESVHWLTPEEMARLPNLLEGNQRFLVALAAGEIDLVV